MLATELLAKYREKLKSKSVEDRYAALTFALQIPSICSRIEFQRQTFPNYYRWSKKYNDYIPIDGDLYKAWLIKYKNTISKLIIGVMDIDLFYEYTYSLRNSIIHTGYIVNNIDCELVLVENKNDNIYLSALQEGKFFISYKRFCNTFFDIAENIFSKYNIEFSMFDDVIIDDDIFRRFNKLSDDKWDKFFKNKDLLDEILLRVFFILRLDKNRIDDMKNFFSCNTNMVYTIDYFDKIYGFVVGYDGTVLRNVKFENGKYVNKLICTFTKSNFDRMFKVVEEWDKFCEAEKNIKLSDCLEVINNDYK